MGLPISSGGLPGVTVSGQPIAGQAPVSSSSSEAAWTDVLARLHGTDPIPATSATVSVDLSAISDPTGGGVRLTTEDVDVAFVVAPDPGPPPSANRTVISSPSGIQTALGQLAVACDCTYSSNAGVFTFERLTAGAAHTVTAQILGNWVGQATAGTPTPGTDAIPGIPGDPRPAGVATKVVRPDSLDTPTEIDFTDEEEGYTKRVAGKLRVTAMIPGEDVDGPVASATLAATATTADKASALTTAAKTGLVTISGIAGPGAITCADAVAGWHVNILRFSSTGFVQPNGLEAVVTVEGQIQQGNVNLSGQTAYVWFSRPPVSP